MATKLDTLWFEIQVKATPGSEKVLARFAGDANKADKAVKTLTKDTDRYSAASKRAAASAATLGAATRRLANMFGGLLVIRAVTRAMVGFDTRMAEIATIADGGAEQIQTFQKAVLALTRSVPQSAQELGAGVYQILSSNIKETNDVMAILEAGAKAAVAGLTNTFTAVDAITTVINAFSLSASEATRVADVLFKTVELGKTKFNQLAAELGTAVTSAALAGVSVEELSAAIAVLTQKGVSVAESTTALNRFFITLTRQTKDQEDAFRALGVEFTIEAVKTKGLSAVLDELNGLTKGQIDAISDLFPNIRAARAAFILLGNGAEMYASVLEKMRNAQGASNRAFEIMNNTVANQARIFRNNLLVIFQEIMVSIAPGLIWFFKQLTAGVQLFVGGIKVMATEAAVTLQQIEIFGSKMTLALGELFDSMFTWLSERFRDLQERMLMLSATLPGVLGDMFSPLAAGAGALAGAIEGVTETVRTNTDEWRKHVTEAEKFLNFLKVAAKQEQLEIVTESDFARLRQQWETERTQREAIELEMAEITAAQLQKREQLEKELARKLRQLTMSSAEQQIWMINDLRKRYKDAFITIGDAAEDAFRRMTEAAEKALRVERAKELGEGLKDSIERALRDIELESFAKQFADEEERQAFMIERRTSILNEAKRAAEEYIQTLVDGGEDTREEQEAIRDVIEEIVELLHKEAKAQEKLGTVAERAARRQLVAMRETVRLIHEAATAAKDMAENFGISSAELNKMIDAMDAIAAGATKLSTGLSTGNFAAIGGGALDIAQGFTSLIGVDPESKRLQRENTEAIQRLTRQLGEFGEIKITGTRFANLQELLDNILTGISGTAILTGSAMRQFRRELEAMGYTMSDVQEAADALGITFKDRLNPTIYELDALLQAMQATELARFAETFTGQLQALRAEFELFDITDPIEQLQRLRDVFSDPNFGSPALRKALAGLDLTTVEGRRQAEIALQRLLQLMQEGELTAAQLGGLTAEQFLEAIKELEKTIDRIGEQEGVTQDIRRQVGITELQANQLLSFQSTLVYRAEERNVLLQELLAAITGDPTVGPNPPFINPRGPNIPTVSVQIGSVNVTATGATTGVVTAESLADEISKLLGEKLEDQQQLFGIAS